MKRALALLAMVALVSCGAQLRQRPDRAPDNDSWDGTTGSGGSGGPDDSVAAAPAPDARPIDRTTRSAGDGADTHSWVEDYPEKPIMPGSGAVGREESSAKDDDTSLANPYRGGSGSGSGSGAGVGTLGGRSRPKKGKHGAKSAAPSSRPREDGEAYRRGGGRDPSPGGFTPHPAPRPVTAPALKAGRHDDNNQYNRFLSFLEENDPLIVYPVDVAERLVVRTLDRNGKSLHNCQVQVKETNGTTLATSTTFADGSTHFFPRAVRAKGSDFAVRAQCAGNVRNGQLSRTGKREVEVRFKDARTLPSRVPVDIAIVIDTTGSMQSQIDRLKKTLKAIHFQLTQLSTKPDLRFGLVAYRDEGDAYLTKVRGFTGRVDDFQRVLDSLDADGGGDTPEDLQSGFDKAMHELKWRKDALRLGFVVADAIPHTDYGQEYNYRETMRESLQRGIKWTMVGAGGLPRAGEVIFRQVAQYTMGEYVFVTASGGGDREGGVGEASHHVGTNYSTENLDQAIVRIVRRELSYLTDRPKDFDYTIVAQGNDATPRDDVLKPAVAEVMRQLVDYSSMQIEKKTPLAVVPVVSKDAAYGDVAEYLTDQILLNATRNTAFRVVDRDLNQVAKEVAVQLGDLFDPAKAVPLGNRLGAELLIVAKLTVTGDKAELFAKLIRVETAEILSVAKVDLLGGIVKRS